MLFKKQGTTSSHSMPARAATPEAKRETEQVKTQKTNYSSSFVVVVVVIVVDDADDALAPMLLL